MLTISVRTSAPRSCAAIARCTLARRSRFKRARSATDSPCAIMMAHRAASNPEQRFMKSSVALLSILSFLWSALSEAEPVAIVADRVIDGVGDRARLNSVVVVDGERIVAMGDRSVIPADARIIELPGRTLMPG